MSIRKPEGRGLLDIRPVEIETKISAYADGGVLIKAGNTHVLCTATVEDSVPKWRGGLGMGWVTGEYALLPCSTHTRVKRERTKISGRTQEIQRLIGRALRTMVNMEVLGEKTIIVDCDVLQADGGTRTASITGGCIALLMALNKLFINGQTTKEVLRDTVIALSVGVKGVDILVDLDYEEDSSCDVDMNFVLTGSGKFVEVQGTAEGAPFSEEMLNRLIKSAMGGIGQLQKIQYQTLKSLGLELLKGKIS